MIRTVKLDEEHLGWRQVGDEVIVLDRRTSKYIGLNATGAALWPLLVAGTTTEALVTHLVHQFGVPEEQARVDVTAFVEVCDRRGLLSSGGEQVRDD